MTPREMEVATRVAKGMSTKSIACDLGVSEETVKTHIRQAAERLGGDTPPRHRLTVWFYSLEIREPPPAQ